MQEEVEHKTVNFAISTTKLTARTFLKGAQFLLRQYDKNASQGKQSMKRLIRQNRGVTNVEIEKTGIACYELIQMITEHNNMAQFEPALLMKWIFKTAVSVWLISNTFEIIMAVFDVTQQVVANSSGIISGNTRVNEVGLSMLEASMMQMEVGPLFGLFLQSFFIGISMRILSIIIFVLVYGRMIEIYMMVSLAPVPMATWGNHEQSHIGQNYLKSLFALGFQGFLILICVAIYAVLIQNVAISGDAINSIWSIVGYTVLLCFTLFKTSSVAKSILGAH